MSDQNRWFLMIGLLATAAQAHAQGIWRELATSSSPPARYLHRLAYDQSRARVVLFGGKNGPQFFNDTWEWNGSSWDEKSPQTVPSVRWGHGLVFDEARGAVLLYGGSTPSGFSSETWAWNGSDWTRLRPDHNPGPRYLHGMTFDSRRQRVVLFGGKTSNNPLVTSGETWEWDGTDWSQRFPTTHPSSRYPTMLAYDGSRDRTLLFGGSSDDVEVLSDTWEWDGDEWAQRTPATTPPARRSHALVYHTVRDRIVLVGGQTPTGFLSDTWEWDGEDWVEISSPASPRARAQIALTYNPDSGSILLFGGGIAIATGTDDTWEYHQRALYVPFGAGCPGDHGVPELAAAAGSAPVAGSILTAELTNLAPDGVPIMLLGFSRDAWGGIPLPFDLSVLGFKDCMLYTSVDFAVPVVNVAGRAAWSVVIPDAPGQRFFNQAFVLEPRSNAGGAITSNAVEATIGQ